ncbi:MAG: methionine gamma-lyase family protein [Clostridia bacterium]|nr:methionine gamma-lyase family protein [Clostridia bacterium]
MNSYFNFKNTTKALCKEALCLCKEQFDQIEEISRLNQERTLKSFLDCKVSESHFSSTTGYGYSDRGREVLDEVYKQIFDAEAALVRHNFVSGTHALTVALFGILRPDDTMLCVTGTPYDTIKSVIGFDDKTKKDQGRIVDFGIKYEQTDLLDNGEIDIERIKKDLKRRPKLVYIQRSKGYSLRRSLLVEDIEKICKITREISPDSIIMVDNCYGEYVQTKEPLSVGADLIVGSMIKNPGAGITPTGGYIAGKKDLVQLCANRLTTPATGGEDGATLFQNREMFMGAFHAPKAVGEALKTSVFASALMQLAGFEVFPKFNEKRGDIVQLIKLGDENKLIKFCQAIQSYSPIDSFLTPEPWDMPGYNCKIIMSSGSFTMGSSIEISADAPLREPYCVFLQGGIDFNSAKIAVMKAFEAI